MSVLLVGAVFLQRHIQFGGEGGKRSVQLVRHVADKLLLRLERNLKSVEQRIERNAEFAQLILLVLHRQAAVDVRGGDSFSLVHNVLYRFQRKACEEVARNEEQREAYYEENDKRVLQAR